MRQGAAMGASSPTFRAGLPATMELGATFVITIAPVAMMLLWPIGTPGQIVARLLIHTLLPIATERTASGSGGAFANRRAGSFGCPGESKMLVCSAIRQSDPMVTR